MKCLAESAATVMTDVVHLLTNWHWETGVVVLRQAVQQSSGPRVGGAATLEIGIARLNPVSPQIADPRHSRRHVHQQRQKQNNGGRI